MEEVVFFHRGTRTLVLADLIENFEPGNVGKPWRWQVRLAGASDPDGKAPMNLRLTFLGCKIGSPRCLRADGGMEAREDDHGPRAPL